MIAALFLLLQPQGQPWRGYAQDPIVAPAPERLGPGPHTLVITDGNSMTRIDYRTGPLCQRARDEIRRQVAPPPSTQRVIYGPPATRAFCVPR